MFMPAELAWLEPVLVLAAVVFVVGLIGNLLSFSNRFVNALVTGLLVAVIGGAIFYSLFRDSIPHTIATPQDLAWLEPVLISAAIVFVVDLIGNMLSFNSRLANALVTALIFAAIFGAVSYMAYKDTGVVPTLTKEVAPATK